MVSNAPFSPLQLRGPLASDAPGVFGLSSFWSHFGLPWLPATWQPVSDSLWAGLEFQVLNWKYISQGFGLCQKYLICCILCLASTHFLQGCPLPWNKWLPRRLSHWAKKAFQPGVSIQGSWLVSQGHWVRSTSPDLKCSWHSLLPDPSPHQQWSLCWPVLRMTTLRQTQPWR